MLDQPKKASELMEILKAAAPFEAALMPDLIDYMARQPKPVVLKPIETVSGVSYLGDVGGIACHIEPDGVDSMIIVSLTKLCVPRTLPFAAAVLDYQKHRIKKLKKQHRI